MTSARVQVRVDRPPAVRAVPGPHGASGVARPLATVRLLGPVRIELAGAEVGGPRWSRARVRSLLALVAMEGPCTRRWLCEQLWPDRPGEAASNNLRVTLSYLRAAMREVCAAPEAIASDRSRIWLSEAFEWSVDVRHFEGLAVRALTHASGAGAERAKADVLHAALAAYGGELMSQLEVPVHLELERERLGATGVRVASALAELLLEQGDHEGALHVACRAAVLDPWSERAGLLVARARAALGDRTGALHAVRRCVALDADLGLAPGREIREVLDALGQDPRR